MRDPSELYEVDREVLAGLAGASMPMLVLLEGFVDAGQLGRLMLEHLREQSEPTRLVRFDHDQLHDYRARRPPMIFDTDHWAGLELFELVIDVHRDRVGRPFLVLSGPEPDHQWERACEAVLQATEEIGVSGMISAGGIPMGVPHTRPVLITAHATDPDLVPGNPVWIDRVTLPGSFVGMLEYVAGERGRAARGFVAHVPHYLAQGTYPPALAPLFERIGQAAGLDFDLVALSEAGTVALQSLTEETATDPEIQRLLATLEEQYDQLSEQGHTSVPSPDEIGHAVEQFLAQHTEDEEN